MSIRPVDMQILIPRATEIGKNQHAADQTPNTQQQQFAEQWKHISAERQSKVQTMEKADGKKVHAERDPAQEKHKRQQQQSSSPEGQPSRDSDEHAEQLRDSVVGHTIDIRT